VNCMLDVCMMLWLGTVEVCCGVERQLSIRTTLWVYVRTICRSDCFVAAKLPAVNGTEACM
jgi:hypothetical protein